MHGKGVVLMPRPAELHVPDTDAVRTDLNSDDVRRVHPDLPPDSSEARKEHLQRCDERAYRRICQQFPKFTPPSRESGCATVDDVN